ncbi:MAG: hypothetical protein AUJ55_11780 [Proteobacteria bacterium CG1_02_64_396]|nr:MAG: hypothetical protein AUJ55_11780 [Proteobacteria bacterium CG1_02_64_396]
MVVLILLLTSFGVAGLSIQLALQSTTGLLLPSWLAAPAALALALPVTRWGSALVAHFLPQDETEAVSEESFIGRVATITLGVARPGSPAQARLHDGFGQTHYVMVEPDTGQPELKQGDHVLLVRQKGSLFVAIPNPHPILIDE